MKKLCYVLVIMCVFLLVGCSGGNGGGNGSEVSVEEMYASIKEHIQTDLRAVGFGDSDFEAEELPGYIVMDVDEGNAEQFLPELDRDDMVEGFTIMASMMLNSDRIIFIQAAPGKVEAVKAALEADLQEQMAVWEDYLADQAEKVRNNIITAQGDYVIYITYGQPEAIESIFEELVK